MDGMFSGGDVAADDAGGGETASRGDFGLGFCGFDAGVERGGDLSGKISALQQLGHFFAAGASDGEYSGCCNESTGASAGDWGVADVLDVYAGLLCDVFECKETAGDVGFAVRTGSGSELYVHQGKLNFSTKVSHFFLKASISPCSR